MRDGWDGDFWQLDRAFPDRAELLRIAADGSAVLGRNERFKYSNIGYSLLGLIIEQASGTPFRDYVTEHVIGPLGLADTGPDLDEARAGDYAAGHTALAYAETRIPIDHIDTGAMSSATGLYSTASDLVRYAAAHFDGDDRLVGADAKRQMQHGEWKIDGGEAEYGLGFEIVTIGGRRVLGHGGGYPGHITRTYFDPKDRLAVCVFTNAIDGPALGMATAAIKLVDLARSSVPDLRHGADAIDLDSFCGTVRLAVERLRHRGARRTALPTLAEPRRSDARTHPARRRRRRHAAHRRHERLRIARRGDDVRQKRRRLDPIRARRQRLDRLSDRSVPRRHRRPRPHHPRARPSGPTDVIS